MANIGADWAETQFAFHVVQLFAGSLGEDFDAAIVQVARPAANSQLSRCTLSEHAIAYTLHSSANVKFTRKNRSHRG